MHLLAKVKKIAEQYIPAEYLKWLTLRRNFLNGSILEYSLVFALFIIFTFLFTNLVVLNVSSQIFVSGPGDGTAGFLWLNYVDKGLNLILSPTDFVNYPYGEALGSASFITYSTLWVPLRVFSYLFGPIAALNIVTFSGFILSATSMYWLTKKLTNSVWVSLFSGFAVAFTPYAIYKSSAHLAYIFSVVFVLIIAAFIGLWKKQTLLRALLFSASIAAAFYTDGYYILLASVLVFCLVLGGIFSGFVSKFSFREFLARLKWFALSVAALSVMLLPIAVIQFTQGDSIKGNLASSRSNIVNEMNEYRAWPVDFFLPPNTNPVLKNNETFMHLNEARLTRSNPSENTNYIGFFMVILLAVGFSIFSAITYKQIRYKKRVNDNTELPNFILVASFSIISIAAMIAFMLSPSIHVFGQTIYMPGQFLLDNRISYWRVMSRFFVPLHVVVVLFSTVSLALILKRIKLMSASGKLKKTGILLVLFIWLITGVEYATSISRPSFDTSKLPAGYQWLSRQQNIKVIAELPFVDALDPRTSEYVTAQLVHGKKMVNIKEPNIARVNNTTGSIDNPEAINYVLNRGAQAIILHVPQCSASFEWGSLIHESDSFAPNTKMCIYSVGSNQVRDDAFLVYTAGVQVSPRYKNTEQIVVTDRVVSMRITDESLVDRYIGNVSLLLNLSCNSLGEWSVYQDDKILSKGTYTKGVSQVVAELDGSKQATISIDRQNSTTPAEPCVIKGATVSSLDL